MCGISGIIDRNNNLNLEHEIKHINDLIAHRGPDSEGFYFHENLALGHRRLSILDLSDDGIQPMEFQDKYTIVFNGEIYNYIEIREELKANGYTFSSDTDTEVVLASYDMWGKSCVKKFNGMWAFAILDIKQNILFCSRDRFGIKPFYYTESVNKFIFGSEIKQLLPFQDKKYVNKKVLLDYLINNIEEYSDETFFENIFKLKQGHNLIFNLNSHTFKIEKYYELTEKAENTTIESYQEELIKAIKLRLRSDVSVGTCLSGGLDSSTLASVASSLNDNKFNAIHARSIDKQTDESKFAKDTAEHTNINLSIISPESSEFIKNIDEVIYTQEEPFGGPSIFMQYFVMQKAKEKGYKVMLDGQGGDETLLGYKRHYPSVFYSIAKKQGVIKSMRALKNSSKQNADMNLKNILKYTLGTFFPSLRLKMNKKESHFIKTNYLKFIDSEYLYAFAEASKSVFELQKIELLKTSLPALLKYEDKNSMRNSIEARVPFIDYKLVEKALSLNEENKINNGWSKYVLRDFAKDYLPDHVIWRKNKFGFESPDKSWLSAHRKDMKKAVSNSMILKEICKPNFHLSFEKLPHRKQWQLFNIAKWEEIYNVEIRN